MILIMDRRLKNLVLKELCPDGIWQLTDVVASILRNQISHLPKNSVSENETRYPESPASMRAFLVKFFTRHYLQTQNSIVKYMTSHDFVDVISSSHLRILDIGSGPAVASLAITDMFFSILEYMTKSGGWPKGKKLKVDYVLNDTSGICLGTGQRMLADYFNNIRRYNNVIVNNCTISVRKSFPDNMNQLRRVRFNIGTYDIIVFSYVIIPMNEDKGFSKIIRGLLDIEVLCHKDGRILILQDKFREELVGKIGRSVGIQSSEQDSTQIIYPKTDANESYTYRYYQILYSPSEKRSINESSVA
jgi:hypothetical protein